MKIANHIPHPLRKLKALFAHPQMPAGTLQTLRAEAADPKYANEIFIPGTPLSAVKNAHKTNVPAEMDASIQGDFNFFEVDTRLEGFMRNTRLWPQSHRLAIAAHDTLTTNGFSIPEWLSVATLSGRGMKFDIKQACALPEILDALRAYPQIPQERLMFNLQVGHGHGLMGHTIGALFNWVNGVNATVPQLQALRQRYPHAQIALGVETGMASEDVRYRDGDLKELTAVAAQVGGPISFPLRGDRVDARTVALLKPYGAISIWNDPGVWSPSDIGAATQHFRDMGCNGVIDLRN